MACYGSRGFSFAICLASAKTRRERNQVSKTLTGTKQELQYYLTMSKSDLSIEYANIQL